MVTKGDLTNIKFIRHEELKSSAFVTAADISRFTDNRKLADKVYDKIKSYSKENNIKNKYESMIEICQISDTSMKRSCNGTQKITRTFLYKLTVGLKMSLDEANEYFMLCGGPLTEFCLEDQICRCALRDKDDILVFIKQFNDIIKQHDKFQKTDKLKVITK